MISLSFFIILILTQTLGEDKAFSNGAGASLASPIALDLEIDFTFLISSWYSRFSWPQKCETFFFFDFYSLFNL